MVRLAVDNVVSAIRLEQTRLLRPRTTPWMSCRGRVEGWVGVRAARAVVLEKAKEDARVEVVTANRE